MFFFNTSRAFWNWKFSIGFEISTFCSSMIRPTVSRISLSTSILPLSSGSANSSLTLRKPLGNLSLFQQMPANPPCQGSELLRPLS